MASLQTAIAIDIGGTKIAASVIDTQGRIMTSAKISTPLTTDAVVAGINELITVLIEPANDSAELAGVGLAVAGTVDWSTGTIVQSPNLPYENLALKEMIERSFGLAAFLDNDGNLATLGEKYFGAAKKANHVIGLTLGTGIGAGIIANGCLYRGATGSAAELGHMIIDPHGPQCTCGSYGCFEEMAAGRALVRIAKERVAMRPDSEIFALAAGNIDSITGSMVTEAAYAGDSTAIGCFEEIGRWLGIGINNVVNIFNPEVIVIGGGMSEAGELVLKPAREVVKKQTLRPNRDVVSIMVAELGNNAGLYGAAALVFNEAGITETV